MWRRFGLGLVAMALGMSITGCGSGDHDKTRVPNPASVFCEQQGGTVDIVDETGGQRGYCVLTDGTRVDEWEYFRQHAPSTTG